MCKKNGHYLGLLWRAKKELTPLILTREKYKNFSVVNLPTHKTYQKLGPDISTWYLQGMGRNNIVPYWNFPSQMFWCIGAIWMTFCVVLFAANHSKCFFDFMRYGIGRLPATTQTVCGVVKAVGSVFRELFVQKFNEYFNNLNTFKMYLCTIISMERSGSAILHNWTLTFTW